MDQHTFAYLKDGTEIMIKPEDVLRREFPSDTDSGIDMPYDFTISMLPYCGKSLTFNEDMLVYADCIRWEGYVWHYSVLGFPGDMFRSVHPKL